MLIYILYISMKYLLLNTCNIETFIVILSYKLIQTKNKSHENSNKYQ